MVNHFSDDINEVFRIPVYLNGERPSDPCEGMLIREGYSDNDRRLWGYWYGDGSWRRILLLDDFYHTPVLQEFMDLPHVNPFPVWPADKPIQPLLYLRPVESESLLPEDPEEWSSVTVANHTGTLLYIFAEGQWWPYPKVVTTEDWNYHGPIRECTSLPLHILSVKAKELEEALRGIIEIGKRDTTNPKYDSYYDYAREVLAKYKV